MSIDEDKRVFGEVRQYCVALSQIALAPSGIFDANSFKTTEALRDVYTHLRDALNPETKLSGGLADYVFVPLSFLLKQPKLGDVQVELLLKTLTLLIRHCWTAAGAMPYVLAKQLFPLITFLTGGSPNTEDKTEINSKSTELQLAGSVALEEFFRSLSKQKGANIYEFFSNVENLPALGHAVTVLLHFAEHGKSVELQSEAIKTLDTLYFELIDDGEILSYILPGNVSSLTKVIASSGLKTHYRVTISAIGLLKKLLVLVYKDEDLKPKLKELESIEDILQESDFDVMTLEGADLKRMHRTMAWLKGTSAQVNLAIINFKKIGNNVRIEVKKELLDFCNGIIQNCLFSLKSSIPTVLSILGMLSNDSRLNIDSSTSLTLPTETQQKTLDKLIATELNTSVESLASVIQSPNENKIIGSLSAIELSLKHSYDQFLVPKLIESTTIELSDMLRKSYSKSKVLDIQNVNSNLMLISKEASELKTDSKLQSVFSKAFSEKVETKLANVFQLIGRLRDPSEMIEAILSEDVTAAYEKAIRLWIANNLMAGYFENTRPNKIMDEFLDLDDGDHEDNSSLAIIEAPGVVYSLMEYSKAILDEAAEFELTQESEITSSIALDTIGIAAHNLREEFRYELVDHLYPVIDSMASPLETVRQHASNTCIVIADNLYHGSLHELVLQNADYLVDAISIRLSNAMTTKATAILALCTKIAGTQIIETFKDVMEIIFSLLDYYHGYEDLCIGFFILFEIISDEVKRKYLSDYDTRKLEYFESSSTYSPWGLQSIEQLKNLLDNSQRDVLIEKREKELEDDVEAEINAPDSDDEEEETETQPVAGSEKEWISPVPEDIYKLLQQVTYYGERLLTHPSVKLHIQILKTYQKIIPILATAPDNLHPITASIWPVVSKTVNNNDPKVVIPGSIVMTQLLEYSGGFLATRFTDLWSQLKTNTLLISAAKSFTVHNKLVLPGLNSKAFESLVHMLITGLSFLGRYIPDTITEEIITKCVGVIPDIEKFGVNADIAWSIKQEVHGMDTYIKERPSLLVDETGEVFIFA